MKRLISLLPSDAIGWLFAILIVGLIGATCSSAVDWFDKRRCRVDGGEVRQVGDHDELRCARSAP